MENLLKKLPIDNIKDIRSVSGGDVNDAYKIYTDKDAYFLKVQKNKDSSFFDGEVAGLNLFLDNDIRAPKVIDYGNSGTDSYLLMTYHEEGALGDQEDLARLVARIHRVESENSMFGFEYPYRGAGTSFENSYKKTWKEVFLYERMDKLRDKLEEVGLFDKKDLDRYEKARSIIEESLDKHKSSPVLCHGDLWAGNFMFDKDNRPMVFDPSPLYGDREFDIGISTVFGGFSRDFYKAYQEILPLDEGYNKRLEFYRLYLLMVHLLKFGEVYDTSVSNTLKAIIG